MLSGIKYAATDAARRSALWLAGALLLIVGLGFVTAAFWRSLALWYGSAGASLILGGIYLGIGLICVALARWPAPPPPPPVRDNRQMLRLMDAFLEGLQAGVRTRRSGRGPLR